MGGRSIGAARRLLILMKPGTEPIEGRNVEEHVGEQSTTTRIEGSHIGVVLAAEFREPMSKDLDQGLHLALITPALEALFQAALESALETILEQWVLFDVDRHVGIPPEEFFDCRGASFSVPGMGELVLTKQDRRVAGAARPGQRVLQCKEQ